MYFLNRFTHFNFELRYDWTFNFRSDLTQTFQNQSCPCKPVGKDLSLRILAISTESSATPVGELSIDVSTIESSKIGVVFNKSLSSLLGPDSSVLITDVRKDDEEDERNNEEDKRKSRVIIVDSG